jgi:hypothetical protein
MRKFFVWFGVLMAAVVVAGVVGVFIVARGGAAADAESKAYVDDTVVVIGGRWDANELWKRSTARFRQATKEDDLRAFFDAARQSLGRLVEYRGSRGEASIFVSTAGTTVSAKYIAQAMFERGAAEFQIAAVKNGVAWKIEGFHLNSPALMKRLVGTRS